MVKSMTGFGAGSACSGGWRAEVTIRTWNHRFLSVRTRSIGDRPRLQSQIEERAKGAFQRGEIGVWLKLQRDGSEENVQLFDHQAARVAHAELRALADELSLSAPPSLEDLIRIGALQPIDEADEEVWPAVEEALDEALAQTTLSRRAEGATLADELERLLDELAEHTEVVSRRLPEITAGLRERLNERVADLDVSVDPDRLEAELVLLSDRYDVQEELVRLGSHIERATALLESDGPIGKELDFISQELLREVNTLGSKARDTEVSSTVIDMKLCVEQFREQVQNVE